MAEILPVTDETDGGLVVVEAVLLSCGARVDNHGVYMDVLFDRCRVSIEPRPPYCDRGRFIVKVDQCEPFFTVDAHDCFPRYYFSAVACASEVMAWSRARRLKART